MTEQSQERIEALMNVLIPGDVIELTAPFCAEDNHCEEVEVPAGTFCLVTAVRRGRGFSVDVIAPNGCVATFDEGDQEPRFPMELRFDQEVAA